MNTCPNCGKIAGLHSSVMQGCTCQYSMQAQPAQESEPDELTIAYMSGLLDGKKKRLWVGLDEQDFSAINQSCLTKLQAATSAESILKEKNNAA